LIAFSGEDNAELPVVMTVGIGGDATPVQVTSGEEPSFSPDGSELAFVNIGTGLVGDR
jgi:hypothetical protein